uniref:Uncharacterized protein n=1 Tax=Triticum urartu TaxID=4572 RepID=A0A8R7UPC8_TRIUA
MLCGRDVVGMLYTSVGCQRRACLTDMCVVCEDSFIHILPISRGRKLSSAANFGTQCSFFRFTIIGNVV